LKEPKVCVAPRILGILPLPLDHTHGDAPLDRPIGVGETSLPSSRKGNADVAPWQGPSTVEQRKRRIDRFHAERIEVEPDARLARSGQDLAEELLRKSQGRPFH